MSTESVPASLLRRLEGASSNKAGLLRDPQQVAHIIYQASRGSKYFQNEQAKDQKLTIQINQLVTNKTRTTTQNQKKLPQIRTTRSTTYLKHTRIDPRTQSNHRMHRCRRFLLLSQSSQISLQTFIQVNVTKQVEEIHNPNLKGKVRFCCRLGSTNNCQLRSKKMGTRPFIPINSLYNTLNVAMAGYIALKLCPHLIFVEPDHNKYQAASDAIMNILRQYDPNLAPNSLDECFMNLTAYCRDHNLSAAEATSQMRQHVLKDTGLTVSAGIGPNVMIAKIAADLNKPNGQFECPPTRDDAIKFMKDLPVRKVPGIGRVTERWLEVLDVKTCGDIWEQRAKLLLMRSEVNFDLLLNAYLGLGATDIKPSQRCVDLSSKIVKVLDAKPLSNLYRTKMISFKKHVFLTLVSIQLKELSEQLARDLSRLHFAGRTLTLKIKLDTFEVLSRSVTPAVIGHKLLSSAEDLYKCVSLFSHAKLLLEREIENRHLSFNQGKPVPGCNGARDLSIRLLGIKVSHLQDQKDPPSTKGNALQNWISNPTASSKTLQTVEPTADNKNDSQWKCPVCNLQMVADDLQTMNEHVDLCLWKISEEGRKAADEDRQDHESRHDGTHIGSKTKRKNKPDQQIQPSTSASASSSSTKRVKADVISSHRSSAKKSNKSGSILDWCHRSSGQ
ncbi:hypothetical protein VP01_1176g2 [Puccinia sorghi]|uniref:DNA polymerase kappa n=1 Tax=Puccinia sorghi TaxID=27349 RepID=A0A0L6VSL9_9BASI|nr:hypothetical protein VP01_1176g2 [Puccinia sorghi]